MNNPDDLIKILLLVSVFFFFISLLWVGLGDE